MRFNHLKAILKTAVIVATVLLLGASLAVAQVTVNLTAGPANATLPDGSAVPMWGYSCDTISANCRPLNPAATATPAVGIIPLWSPVVITVPTGQSLTISLTNRLTFTPTGGTPNSIPTSLVIVGQLGGGLGTTATSTTSPTHATQTSTWPITGGGSFTPPSQGPRVQSFATEVAAGATTVLPWGVSPPALNPGTYLFESGTHPSIQGPMGLYGMLVVTTAPAGGTAGTAYPAGTNATLSPAVVYGADVPLLMSEIDPAQNNAVNTAVNTAGFTETAVWSGQPGGCGNPSSPVGVINTCYPPAVNYKPLYYLFNGVAFNKTASPSPSLFATTPATGVVGNVLVRFVNAGLRMHVPSIVGAQTGTANASGFSLIAEDGNVLPGIPRVQSEVFMAAGKTYDVVINPPAATVTTALPVFDRELSLSANSTGRDSGMLAYIGVNTAAALPSAAALTAAIANPDTYDSVIPGQTLTVSDPGKGVIANDVNVFGVQVQGTPPTGLTLYPNGTFTYTAGAATSFTYCANGGTTACALVTLGLAPTEAGSGITMNPITFTSNVATSLSIKPPGVLVVDSDGKGYPLTVVTTGGQAPVPSSGLTLSVDPNGGFNASVAAAGTYTFTYHAQNSQGTVSSTTATVTLNFLSASGLAVHVVDGRDKATAVADYRWVIEEDRTFFVNPACIGNPAPAGCPLTSTGASPTFGTNFHTSYMPVIATGCTGPQSCEGGQTVLGTAAVCDVGNGVCRTTAAQQTPLDPGQVHLDPTKRYYISVLPGDAANSFENAGGCLGDATADCGHGMGGAPIACTKAVATEVACTATDTFSAPLTIYVQPNPFPPSKLSVFVFEDDFPLNGEQDGGGGIDVLSPNEPGLGGFNITMFDDAGGSGDATGQMTYDMFNQPLSNSLAGTKDPNNGNDACPISANALEGVDSSNNNTPGAVSPTGITGTIVTCPKYESDGKTLSPLAGQAVVANLMPGRYGIVATPAADRIGRGEEWLQTNTLDGQKAHDSFLRIGEPSFFQEFGPAGYHVSIGFANPAIINGRKLAVCNGTDPQVTGTNCNHTITGTVTTERMSRTPDERLYGSGDNSSFAFSQCYVSFGDADGEDFAFTKCDQNGNFSLSGLPSGDWRVTVFDQWNDMLVDGLSTPVRVSGGSNTTLNLGQIAMNQWQANIYTSTFFDANGNGVRDPNEQGLTLVPTNIRFRDGSYSNFNNTDLFGNAGFNEVFPLFSWYVVESDTARYKNTGTHVVYDAGGPADGTCTGSTAPCGSSTIAGHMANTAEVVSVPTSLRVPGAVYCASADCTGRSIATPGSSDPPSVCTTNAAGTTTCSTRLSTGRIDPAWVGTEGWQGFSGQNSFIEFGKKPFAAGENGGIHGEVIYASTRPFDDPSLLIHTSWTPDVPGVTINLYQEGTAPDGSQSLTLVDTTKTTSWDDWAQGFYPGTTKPYMNCPGQGQSTGVIADLFFFTLYNQPSWLDVYNNNPQGVSGPLTSTAIPNNSQFKCYDGMHNWNQIQPAPYDGMYQFPSILSRNPTTGVPVTPTGVAAGVPGHASALAGTNCIVCTTGPDGSPMLPVGKYVVEMIVPPGYELVKEEDKNILIGDNYIAPVTQQFGGLGAIFIMPDQAEVGSLYNANNPQNPTQTMGRTSLPSSEGDTGSVEVFWPCVGASRVVPDFISLFPGSAEVSPFAGATRNLCDRKEVQLTDQASVLAKFWIFTSAHVAAHFTGVITDDYTSEFDPFSPQFGEKFSPANLPVSIKDWSGTEIARTYADQWGTYDGLSYSTWEVNPPNPTGYAPTMMVVCMNDPGTGAAPDPLFNPQYSQFCYEIPFMPGQTQYMDTPVVPTSAYAGAGYNNPDCDYQDATPAISEVDGDGIGPWVGADGKQLTIYALGTQPVQNYGYSGPSAATAPFNQKAVTRDFGFGGTQGTVTIGGVPATVTGWSPSQITVTVNLNGTVNGQAVTVPQCAIQQQAIYGGSTAYCGQLVITRGDNGRQSIDAVTVTVGGKAPTHVAPTAPIQAAIDSASPGDMLMIDSVAPAVAGTAGTAATHYEMLLMWKPLRLQGVGAVSSIINASTHPAGKMDPWRRQVNCLFGLSLSGTPLTSSNQYDPSGTFTCSAAMQGAIDRLPLEATVGWDATLNGNLAELLQEPSLMGALEGAGITVLGKGVNLGPGVGTETNFPTGTTLLNASVCTSEPYPSSFWCNPSSIDGLSITDSSQGGGGIFIHGWNHNLEVANNRIHSNAGSASGGINLGQGEFPPNYTQGGTTNADPGSCAATSFSGLPGSILPYCLDMFVNIHHNSITSNSSTGDELFSATPAGAGGASFCTGSDYYKFNYNWVCGNLSSGDGGGIGQIGFVYNGDIEHNTIIFNQSTNPTIAANGGGIILMGAPDADAPCGGSIDTDCVPVPANSIGPSDGTGPGLVINANLIMGNSAESGSGGGIAIQNANGSDVVAFPDGRAPVGGRSPWNDITITNNIITNNVAGWDGGGISLTDALNVNIVNNTIMSNDSTASSGILFQTLGAPLASSSGANCHTGGPSCPQVAGLVSIHNSVTLTSNLPSSVVVWCPAGHYSGASQRNGACRSYSFPLLENNALWQNRSFQVAVGGRAPGVQNQQNVVTLRKAFSGGALADSQSFTGACPSATNYWDIGVRGDTGPTNHAGGMLDPVFSELTSTTGYDASNTSTPANVVSQYCNGSRVPPELGRNGWLVPPGIADATVPNPLFSLTPAATVDEGNNWVNISWGPLSQTNPTIQNASGNFGGGPLLGNYAPAPGSGLIDGIACTTTAGGCLAGTETVPAPTLDFFGNPRPDATNPTAIDFGAVEIQGNRGTTGTPTLTAIKPTQGIRGTVVSVVLTGTNLASATSVTVSGGGDITATITAVSSNQISANFTISATAALTARDVTANTPAGSATLTGAFTVVSSALASISPSSGTRGTAVPVTLTGTNFAAPATVTVTTAGFGVNITVGPVTVVNSTTITTTFTIAGGAGTLAGPRNVNVTTPSGPATGTVQFTVIVPAAPTLTSVSPNSGSQGTAVPVTLTGTNFVAPVTVNRSGGAGSGITISGVTLVSSTQITATFTISATAPNVSRNISVTTPGGTSNNVPFTVGASLSSISPNRGLRGTVVPVTITGTNLAGATAITAGGGITAAIISTSSTTVTANFTITAGATLTTRNVTVTTPQGSPTLPAAFTVYGATLASVAPTSSGHPATNLTLTFTGTDLSGVNAITGLNGGGLSGVNLVAGSLTVVNPTTVTVRVNIAATATTGVRNMSLLGTNGNTNTVSFTVN
jgi:hypothetical protein